MSVLSSYQPDLWMHLPTPGKGSPTPDLGPMSDSPETDIGQSSAQAEQMFVRQSGPAVALHQQLDVPLVQ